MSTPPMEIYQLEDQLEQAVQAWLLANGVNDAKRQREDNIEVDGSKRRLATPRVEAKALMGAGAGANEHYYVSTSTNQRWLDIWQGTLYLKIVTRRDVAEPAHKYLRALCRYLMQFVSNITGLLKYHKIEKMIETACTSTIEPDKIHDVSALSFNVWMRIRPEFFPTS